MMFRSYNTTSEYFFRRLCSYSNGNLKTCDNNLILISYFYMRKYMDFLSGRNPDKTPVFI